MAPDIIYEGYLDVRMKTFLFNSWKNAYFMLYKK